MAALALWFTRYMHHRAFLLHMFVTKLSAAGQFYSAMRHRTQWIGAPFHVGGRSRIRIWPGSLKAAVKRLQSALSRSYSRVVSYPLVGCVVPVRADGPMVHHGLWSIVCFCWLVTTSDVEYWVTSTLLLNWSYRLWAQYNCLRDQAYWPYTCDS